jgi:hypothetical protein
MSKLDDIKAQIGWLKIIFGAMVAAGLSVVAWLLQNFNSVVWYETAFAGVMLIALIVFTYKIH